MSLSIHGRIQAVRLRKQLSIRHCAREMGWHDSRWRRLEAGRPIYTEELLQISRVLSVSCAFLLGELDGLLPPWSEGAGDQAAAANG